MSKGKLYELYEDWSEFSSEHDIKVLLDEAKKEFPADAHGLKVDEVMPWFWKYFGDGESE